MRILTLGFALSLLLPVPLARAECGGDFSTFVSGLKAEAVAKGHDPPVWTGFLPLSGVIPRF
jgi:hypothetical protein